MSPTWHQRTIIWRTITWRRITWCRKYMLCKCLSCKWGHLNGHTNASSCPPSWLLQNLTHYLMLIPRKADKHNSALVVHMVCSRFYQLFWKFEKYKLNLLHTPSLMNARKTWHFLNASVLDCLYRQLLHDSPEFLLRQYRTGLYEYKSILMVAVFGCFTMQSVLWPNAPIIGGWAVFFQL